MWQENIEIYDRNSCATMENAFRIESTRPNNGNELI